MSKGQPLFTVATITYNSANYIRQAIESVLSSSYEDFEFLISDDCSTDNTWQIIQEYKDSRIKSWRNESNIGEYPNRNKVIKEASGNYILFVDGDDILYRDSLRNLSEYLCAFPNVGMVWGLNPQLFPFYVFPYILQPQETIQMIYRTKIPISNIGFGEMLFRTDLLQSVGGMSEYYKSGDTYIKLKLALMEPVMFASIGFIFWRQSPGQASKKLAKGHFGFIERNAINDAIIADPAFPLGASDKAIIAKNLRISKIKIFFSSTLLKGNIVDFFKLGQKIGIHLKDLLLLFKKGDYSYRPSNELGNPFANHYHFTKKNKNESN
jgi:glycosyltransferase involved in cell wall biosynthesis